MQFRAKGKLDDGTSFSIRLPAAANFMAAFAGVGRMLEQKLGSRAGAVVRLSISAEEADESFKLGAKRKKGDASPEPTATPKGNAGRK